MLYKMLALTLALLVTPALAVAFDNFDVTVLAEMEPYAVAEKMQQDPRYASQALAGFSNSAKDLRTGWIRAFKMKILGEIDGPRKTLLSETLAQFEAVAPRVIQYVRMKSPNLDEVHAFFRKHDIHEHVLTRSGLFQRSAQLLLRGTERDLTAFAAAFQSSIERAEIVERLNLVFIAKNRTLTEEFLVRIELPGPPAINAVKTLGQLQADAGKTMWAILRLTGQGHTGFGCAVTEVTYEVRLPFEQTPLHRGTWSGEYFE
jgi:hypothetical protein